MGAMLLAEHHLTRSLAHEPSPPAEPAELVAWLEARAPAVDEAALAPGRWPGLAGQPALATWAVNRLADEPLEPAVARGLAVHAVPPFVLRSLAPDAGLPVESLAVLLAPALADRVAAACPGLDVELRSAVCSREGRQRAEQGRDRALARALQDTEPGRSLWAVELASGLGGTGARVAESAWRAATDDAARGRALIVLARTLPADEAIRRLRPHLAPEDPLAPVAVLELSRLEGGAEVLGAMAGETGALGALAEVSRARAEGRRAASGTGLLDRGL